MTAVQILRELSTEWEEEYEALTREFGAYGQMKTRGAYHLASVLASQKADKIEAENATSG